MVSLCPPNVEIRLSVGRVAAELLMDISISRLDRNAHSFTEIIYLVVEFTQEKLYPDKDITKLKVTCTLIS